ncbi:MAG: hypothetical protein D6694_12715, partial [Gammaproteobacteria bacterium]
HNLNQATADTQTGQPYLRGNWIGNPYPEDGAPQAGTTYTTPNKFGRVPRGGSIHNETGGYQIDQNNGNPNIWTADEFGGLCELCHGNGDGTWTASEIDTINKFGNAANAWVGTNGHSAAVKGGGDSVAANIYRESYRTVTLTPTTNTDYQYADIPRMAYQHQSSRGAGIRDWNKNSGGAGKGFDYSPMVYVNGKETRAFNDYDWGATTDDGTTDPNFHNFTCSKCHNPHASRLPRLMITNCLDTKHNDWDDNYVLTAPKTNLDGGSTITANSPNGNVQLSNATSAQNCHRVKDPAFNKTNVNTGGWNLVTPWTNEGTPDNGTIQ